jgi:hypothetical protein
MAATDPNVQKWNQIKAKLNMAIAKLKNANTENQAEKLKMAMADAQGLIEDVVNTPPGTFPAIQGEPPPPPPPDP